MCACVRACVCVCVCACVCVCLSLSLSNIYIWQEALLLDMLNSELCVPRGTDVGRDDPRRFEKGGRGWGWGEWKGTVPSTVLSVTTRMIEY